MEYSDIKNINMDMKVACDFDLELFVYISIIFCKIISGPRAFCRFHYKSPSHTTDKYARFCGRIIYLEHTLRIAKKALFPILILILNAIRGIYSLVPYLILFVSTSHHQFYQSLHTELITKHLVHLYLNLKFACRVANCSLDKTTYDI